MVWCWARRMNFDYTLNSLFVYPWNIIKICRSWSASDSLDYNLPRRDEQIWMKVQRNTYEPSPKSEVDFVPNWRLIEKRQLWLQYPTETCFSSWYWLLLCVACQWCAQRQWFNAIFSQNLASKFPQVKLDRFYGFVPPTHFQEQVGWGSWLGVDRVPGLWFKGVQSQITTLSRRPLTLTLSGRVGGDQGLQVHISPQSPQNVGSDLVDWRSHKFPLRGCLGTFSD